MERFLCIHGHFYQPPRENPWLEAVELQDSAYPYHDWNERINAECYARNTAARILNDRGWIRKIFNNYSRISFNFGPTLLDWLESSDPEVYQAIIEADRASQQFFSGHGSAMAQAYNHMIMPLANRRDKYTQIYWGIEDFKYRFGREPEGMWLPETAVDLETLDIMAEQGIRFTVLTPYQAGRVRVIGGNWQEVGPEGIDPTMPYLLRLPESGRQISIFFYNGPISQAVAFEGLLSNGESFAHRLLGGFSPHTDRPQLVHIATDGETYGHHHRHGEMALAYALEYIESNRLARITNYGEFLALHPPTHEVEIKEQTAWSCAHGVDRWQDDCGCHSGTRPGWVQTWRAPLRRALNWLRDTMTPHYEKHAGRLFKDPWAARNDYISVVLDRSPENVEQFLASHAKKGALNAEEQVTALKLLEMQRHAMLMFTSCGWFFDDISGIETIQVLQYARRVIQLAGDLFDTPLEPLFLEMLARAKSNDPQYRDGAYIYNHKITPAMVDLPKVGGHYGICSIFENYDKHTRIFCYDIEKLDNRTLKAGTTKLSVGKVRVTSMVTRESAILCYGAIYFAYHNVSCSVQVFNSEQQYRDLVQKITDAFNRADFPEVILLLNRYFKNGSLFTLKQLFRDRQRKILSKIMQTTLTELENQYQQIYLRHATLMRFLKDLGIPLPQAMLCATELNLNAQLRSSFTRSEPDIEHINALFNEAKTLDIKLDDTSLGYVIRITLEKMAESLHADPSNLNLLGNLDTMTGLARTLPIEVDLWKVQNIYYRLLHEVYPYLRRKAEQGDEETWAWVGRFAALGEKLKIQRDN
ncbi:DUF3536 domain-containing protein [Desulfallas thermosapovorans]|uniref:Glycosyl hydrolase family 57 n=1 Tax=Desulfallas thermosapovorans DSM 6562 TaxID=1121431 RepID=A0A5S4ZPI5_9FIRM|nr:DUF3536 domain-containing protein [Desulfallas thermosapovorans]TYO94719.1 glycosyl hydrolase family 57 [Desulfallas thermosapovorans DSM 6562]